ncbi:MAG: flippase-like domain-containing protein [Tannerella sp.]|jgi:uncharacterized protein (TIRG00374 family)|nr:flippase-like domain-containing protein [Tannerella sp.]
MDFKQILRKIIKVLLPLSLGVILLWYLYRNQDLGEMMNVIKKGVRYDVILFSLIFGLMGNIIRALRWSMLIDSLGKRVRRKNVIYAVLGNYAINMALPRVGEIWRCGVTSKYEKVPFTKLLGTLFVDRIMDTIVVGLLTLCLCIFNIGFFQKFFSENPPVIVEAIYNIVSSIWTYVGLALFALLIWLIFVKLKHLLFVQKIIGVIKNILEGIKSLWKIEQKVRFIIETLLIWCCYFLYFYITFFAFDFTKDLGIRIGLIAFAMSSIGVAAPVQGGIGVWHFMVISTLVAFGVDSNDAGAFAMVVFAIQTVWVVLVGLFGIAALPIANKNNEVKDGVEPEN